MRVNAAIEYGSFFANEALRGAFHRAAARGGDVHLLGLVSCGGVHSHIDHLRALLELAAHEGMSQNTWIHAFTDGRDVSPHSAATDLAELPRDRIATVCGRYYAMDRDSRWERTDRAFLRDLRRRGSGRGGSGRGDRGELCPGRDRRVRRAGGPDRSTAAGSQQGLGHLLQLPPRPRASAQPAAPRGRGRHDHDDSVQRRLHPVPSHSRSRSSRTRSQRCSRGSGARQLHAAETEKYAHVTYFFNGGEEREWEGETRILVPSPRDVPSYDLKPEMSADEVAARFCAEVGNGYRFAVVNFANPDMVGHTGSIPAVVRAVEETDRCLGKVLACVKEVGGVCLVTADHGNAEVMLEADGVEPAYGAHDESRASRGHRQCVRVVCAGRSSPTSHPRFWHCYDLSIPAEMTGKTSRNQSVKARAQTPYKRRSILAPASCRFRNQTSESCARPSVATSAPSRSSCGRTSSPSSTTSSA